MFRIAICDDVAAICHQIESILLAYAKDFQILLDIEVFYSGEDLKQFMKSNHDFDLIYLDIEMDGLSGLDISREIRQVSNDLRTEIVFISGTTQYDRMLFDVQPLHFIPKPIEAGLVIRDLELAMYKAGHSNKSFTFHIDKEIFRISFNDILYFESHNRQITVVTLKKSYTYYGTIRSIASQLPGFFCRIHNSYVINMHLVSSFRKKQVTMLNGDILPVGSKYHDNYMEYQQQELLGDGVTWKKST